MADSNETSSKAPGEHQMTPRVYRAANQSLMGVWKLAWQTIRAQEALNRQARDIVQQTSASTTAPAAE